MVGKIPEFEELPYKCAVFVVSPFKTALRFPAMLVTGFDVISS
jgi:hypothetical protein